MAERVSQNQSHCIVIMNEYPTSGAYIISAQSDVERSRLATEFAAALVCVSVGNNRPCRSCVACRKAFSGGHPDIMLLSSYDKEGKRNNISVAQAREIIRDSSILPNEARSKVYIIDNAEDMNIQAQNAMLKLLEEPPTSVSIILCVSNPAALLPTVLSRCGVLRSSEDLPGADTNPEAAEYLDLVADRDVPGLIRFATAREGMESEALAAFIDSIRTEQLSRMTLGGDSGAIQILPLLDELQGYVAMNVGVKHIWGVLMSAKI